MKIILSLLGGIPRAAALCCNLTHQTCGSKSDSDVISMETWHLRNSNRERERREWQKYSWSILRVSATIELSEKMNDVDIKNN